MTIFGNVAYGLRLQKVPETEIRRRVLKVLELVEIGNLADVETRKPALSPAASSSAWRWRAPWWWSQRSS